MNKTLVISRAIGKIMMGIAFIFMAFSNPILANSSIEAKMPHRSGGIKYYDETKTLTNEVKDHIDQVNLTFKESGLTNEFVVAVIEDLRGLSFERYANRFFNDWGIGLKSDNRGALLLVYVEEGKVKSARIELGNGTEEYINAAKAGRILDKTMVELDKDEDLNNFIKITSDEFYKETISSFEVDGAPSEISLADQLIDTGEPGALFIAIFVVLPISMIAAFTGNTLAVIIYSIFIISFFTTRFGRRIAFNFLDLIFSSSGSSSSRRGSGSGRSGGGSSSGGGASRSR